MAAGRAATLYVLVAYLAVIFPVFAGPGAKALALLFLIAALTWITISGMRKSIGGLAIGTVLKLSPILILCFVAYSAGGIATSYRLPNFGSFESVALLVFFAFSGANSSAYAAGELKNPRRDLPITMLSSLALIIVFYMAVQWAFIAAGAPHGGDEATPLAAAARAVMGEKGALALSLAAIFSVGTNALSFYIAGARVAYGMANRGLLPETFAHISPRYRTPDRSVLLFSGIVAIMVASGAFTFLASVTSLGGQGISLVVFAAFVVLMRRTDNGHDGQLALYWWPILAVGTFFAIFTVIQAPPKAFLLLAGLLVVGTVLYTIARRETITAPEPEFD